jgi:hypothetical protein
LKRWAKSSYPVLAWQQLGLSVTSYVVRPSSGWACWTHDPRAHVTSIPTLHIEIGDTSVTTSCYLPVQTPGWAVVAWWVGHPWLGIVRLTPLACFLMDPIVSLSPSPCATVAHRGATMGFWSHSLTNKNYLDILVSCGLLHKGDYQLPSSKEVRIRRRASWFHSCTSTSVAPRCLPTPS